MKNQINFKKLIIILGLIIIAIILLIFFIKKAYNPSQNGNNIGNKSLEDIKNYILNISSYEAQVEVTVNSNKNTNKYILKQSCVMPDAYTQEILEPQNIKNLKTIYDGKTLKIENTKINLTKIYEEYQHIVSNTLFLSTFIENYKNDENSNIKTENENIVLECKIKNDNQYQNSQKLYISKNTGMPIKMEIKDANKNTLVYILYNEIKINSTKKEDILAFALEGKKENI
ncbi:MAG: hypothetical protein IKT41_04160 [Clostridia bacterium]|nr:hypothetical protein [Clostridia bacterium]